MNNQHAIETLLQKKKELEAEYAESSQPSLPLDWEKEFDTAFCNEIIESNGTEGGLRDNELQMFWEGAEFLRNKAKEWFKTHLLSKVSYGSGMNWVKASERLPEDDSIKFLRHRIGDDNSFYLKDTGYYRKAKHLFYCNQGQQMWEVNKIEWLDESSATLSDEDIERMAEKLLVKIMQEEPIKACSWFNLQMGKGAVASHAGEVTITMDADIEDKRYKIKTVTTVEELAAQHLK